ncbi:MAG: glycogen phosphorylase, partial [Planctomycetota bacterium]
KKRIAKYIQEKLDITLSPHAIFDVQIKRIHEYKRQLMNILEIILLYKELKENPNLEIPPVVFLFGGKAAPGYYMAKKIIKFIHNVANLINKDPKTKDRIQIVFVPNYGVTLAELLIPGTDISQQISTAGHEASGTGNMKFALNGALTLGTLDGANVEILEQVGEENIFIFGLKAEEIYQMRESGTYRPKELLKDHPQLQEIMDWIMADHFSLHEPGIFEPLVHSLLEQGDYFFVLADLLEYHQTRKKMFRLYQENSQEWMQKSLINIARMGYFSSDRTIMEYSTKVWNIQSCPVDMTKKKSLTLRFHKLDLGNHDT